MKRLYYILIFSSGMITLARAQKPFLLFQQDSLSIGEKTAVSLVYKHHGDKEVFFPDGSWKFQPFEFIEKNIFPTVTQDSVSTDSAVYLLQTFSTQSYLSLRLPVFLKSGDDSTLVWSNTDSVVFKGMIPDSLLGQTRLLSDPGNGIGVFRAPRGKGFYITLGITLLTLLLALFFKTHILKALEILRLNKRQREFHSAFKGFMLNHKAKGTLNEANILWRNYLEQLEGKPYTSLSSLEIEKLTENEQVGNALREVESALFGGRESDRIPLALQILSKFARDRFKLRKVQFKKNRNNG